LTESTLSPRRELLTNNIHFYLNFSSKFFVQKYIQSKAKKS
jgi:hypothetical protein